MKTFLISDTHFCHRNIITFKDEEGKIIRNFQSMEEHDEHIINKWNQRVSKNDKVYHLGDVGMSSWTNLERVLSRLNGTKVLIKGNHDCHKPQQYLKWFKDIRSTWILDKFVLTHIPIHPESLSRWKANLHGHTHHKKLDDIRYYNLCVEQHNYWPIDFDFIREKLK